jgi:short-subunit dehydrogenase
VAGNGMGREIVLNLLKRESNVIAIDINEKGLEETRQLSQGLCGTFSYTVMDITNREAVAKWAHELLSSVNVDVLINNAGIIQPFVRVQDIDVTVSQRILNVNFWGALNMIQLLLPNLLERPEAHIVNISSMGGFIPIPGQAIYGASKAAIKLLSESLAIELSETNVSVSTIFPGAMNTNIKKNSGIDEKCSSEEEHSDMALSPNKAAEIVISSIENEEKTVYVGDDSIMMSQLYKKDPDEAVRKITSRINHKF